jgi:hypothetical protein
MRRSVLFAAGIVVLCASAARAAETVKIGAYVGRLYDLNPATDSFSTVIQLWTLSPAASPMHPIQTVRLGETRSSTSTTPSELVNNGVLWGYREFSATINQKFDMQHFPFDHHTLRIRLVEISWSTKYLTYVADSRETRIDPRVSIPGWNVTRCRIETHLVTYPTHYGNPAATTPTTTWSEAWVLIDVRRDGLGVFIKIVLVAYISFALMMLSFLMDASLFSSRVSLLVGSLFATVVSMRGAEGVLGRTDDFTMVDQIHLLVAFFILVSATTGLITRRMEASRAQMIDRWTALTSLLLFLVANVLLIGSALRA